MSFYAIKRGTVLCFWTSRDKASALHSAHGSLWFGGLTSTPTRGKPILLSVFCSVVVLSNNFFGLVASSPLTISGKDFLMLFLSALFQGCQRPVFLFECGANLSFDLCSGRAVK